MEVKIQQWGNSSAIRLPATALKQMSLMSGDVLKLDISDQAITLTPIKSKVRYRLSDLVAQCDLDAPEPAELAAWHNIQAVGREA